MLTRGKSAYNGFETQNLNRTEADFTRLCRIDTFNDFYLTYAAAAFLQRGSLLVNLSLKHAVKDALYQRRHSRQ